MAEQSRYCRGTLIRGGTRTPIVLGRMLYSDVDRDPPKNIFKRMKIKDSDRNYTIPDTVEGLPCIGFEDEWARGWSHHGYYSMSSSVCFIPFHFFGVEQDDKYNGEYIPSILTKGGYKWRLDFYKKTVIDTQSFKRMVRFDIKGGLWVHANLDGSERLETWGLSLSRFDSQFKKCIASLAGKGYNINRFHWTQETLDLLEGWRPCFVREDMDGPFSIEYNSNDHIYE